MLDDSEEEDPEEEESRDNELVAEGEHEPVGR